MKTAKKTLAVVLAIIIVMLSALVPVSAASKVDPSLGPTQKFQSVLYMMLDKFVMFIGKVLNGVIPGLDWRNAWPDYDDYQTPENFYKGEDEFQTTNVLPNVEFDYSILKSDAVYEQDEYDAIKQLYDEYNKNMQLFLKQKNQNELGDDEVGFDVVHLKDIFINECNKVCPSSEILANIVVDLCYTSNKNKTFAWDVVGEQIYQNVLKNNNYTIKYPVKDNNGEIDFCGNKFSLYTQQIGGDLDADFE